MTTKDPKGNVRTGKNARARVAADAADGARHRDNLPNPLETEPAPGVGSAAIAALSDLLMRDDGWLRISPDGEGKVVYWKWKFTRGPHAGCYVMCVFAPWEVWQAIAEVGSKIERSYLGLHRPTKDSYYDS